MKWIKNYSNPFKTPLEKLKIYGGLAKKQIALLSDLIVS